MNHAASERKQVTGDCDSLFHIYTFIQFKHTRKKTCQLFLLRKRLVSHLNWFETLNGAHVSTRGYRNWRTMHWKFVCMLRVYIERAHRSSTIQFQFEPLVCVLVFFSCSMSLSMSAAMFLSLLLQLTVVHTHSRFFSICVCVCVLLKHGNNIV